jgi:hypothetical protein
MWMMMVAACSLVALMLEDDSAVKMVKLTKTGSHAGDNAGRQSKGQSSSLPGGQKKS